MKARDRQLEAAAKAAARYVYVLARSLTFTRLRSILGEKEKDCGDKRIKKHRFFRVFGDFLQCF